MSSQAVQSASNFKPTGLRGREYAKFRSPRRNEVAAAVVIDDNAAFPASKNVTASGETSVIAAPGAGLCIRVKLLMANNADTDAVTVSFREGTSGSDKFKNLLPPSGGVWNFNLIGAYWILKPNTALLANLSGTSDVNIQVGYDLVTGLVDPAPTDALTITESHVAVKA